MLLLLQTHDRLTSRELARRFEVSQRTILRDVEALSAAGAPIRTERGRYGAIVLDRRARLDLARLNPAEIQLLTTTGIIPSTLAQIGLGNVSAQTQQKLAAAASRMPHDEALPLADVLRIDSSGWFSNEHNMDLHDLLEAARNRRRIRLRYRRSGELVSTQLLVDPYGLINKAASWYLIGDVKTVPRMFKASRIETYEVLQEQADLRAGQTLTSVWDRLMDEFSPARAVTIHAKLRATRLDLARRILGSRIINIAETQGEWVQITLAYPEMESVRQLLQFGDHIQVISPPDAVRRIHDLACHLAQAHPSP